MRERKSRGSERGYRRLKRVGWKPSFSQAQKINFVVKDKVLQKFRFVVLRSDGRGRANIEVGKD